MGALISFSACAPAPQTARPAWLDGPPPAYDYPIRDPYAATIITTPAEMRIAAPGVPPVEERKLDVFPGRTVPDGFWYQTRLHYGVVLQPRPAPVVYVIAGTGADWRAGNMRLLADIFYLCGYHVVLLPSPTHPNFIISASGNFIPGRPTQSAEDLYRVMGMIDVALAPAGITGHALSGYSLGGMDAAYVARLDADRKALNFGRVLLIDPPLHLAASMDRLDRMLYRGLLNGVDGLDGFIDEALAKLSAVSTGGDALDFSNRHLLLDAYRTFQPTDDELATTIGLGFRFAGANMITTADIMSHAGYIYPKNRPFTTSTSMNGTMGRALRTSFMNYFQEMYSGFYLAANPGLQKADLLAEGNLDALGDFIANNPRIGLVTNQDDLVLAPGEAGQLAALFGNRARVFPTGGHLGNLAHPAVARAIADFMRPDPVSVPPGDAR